MVTFRKKSLEENLIPKAIKYLEEQNRDYTIISEKQADVVSKVNSKAMVLMNFFRNENGFYQFTVKDKEFYSYTRKLLKDYFDMRILNTNPTERTVTAETNHLGIALDLIDVLAARYNLSIVEK